MLTHLGFSHWLEFNEEINLLFVEYSHNVDEGSNKY